MICYENFKGGALKALGSVDDVASSVKGLKGIGAAADTAKSLKNLDSLKALNKGTDAVKTLGKASDASKSLGKQAKLLDDAIQANPGKALKDGKKLQEGMGKTAYSLMSSHPRLAFAGLTAAGVGVYASMNGLTFGEGLKKLVGMGAKELGEIVSTVTKATGQVAGTALNELIAGLLGIDSADMWMVWYGLGALILISLYMKFF
jgi:hypothetical protein